MHRRTLASGGQTRTSASRWPRFGALFPFPSRTSVRWGRLHRACKLERLCPGTANLTSTVESCWRRFVDSLGMPAQGQQFVAGHTHPSVFAHAILLQDSLQLHLNVLLLVLLFQPWQWQRILILVPRSPLQPQPPPVSTADNISPNTDSPNSLSTLLSRQESAMHTSARPAVKAGGSAPLLVPPVTSKYSS